MTKKRSPERLAKAQRRREFRQSPEGIALRAQRQKDAQLADERAQLAKDHETALLHSGYCPKCKGIVGWYEAAIDIPVLSTTGKVKFDLDGEIITRQLIESIRCCPTCGFVELPAGADEVVHVLNDTSPGMKITEYLYCGPGAMA